MKKPKTVTAAALTATALLSIIGTTAVAAATNPDAFTNDSPGEYNEMYAIVRIGDPIYIHTDAGHGSMNATDWYIASNGNLVIRRDVSADEHAVACHVLGDETIARLGIDVGCSGGRSTTQVWMYKDGVRVLPDDPMFGSNKANLWVHTVGWDPAG